jgi:hypothetical protein
MPHGLIDSSTELEQSAQVDMCVRVIRIECERLGIGVPSHIGIGVFDVRAELEPLCGGDGRRLVPCRAVKAASH